MKQAKEWTILGKDLVAQVSCTEPYEWQGSTETEWEFSKAVLASNGSEPLHVRPLCIEPDYSDHSHAEMCILQRLPVWPPLQTQSEIIMNRVRCPEVTRCTLLHSLTRRTLLDCLTGQAERILL